MRCIAGSRIWARGDSPIVATGAPEAFRARAIARLRGPSSRVEELLDVITARREAARLADLERRLERRDLIEIAPEERDPRTPRDPGRESSDARFAR